MALAEVINSDQGGGDLWPIPHQGIAIIIWSDLAWKYLEVHINDKFFLEWYKRNFIFSEFFFHFALESLR